MNIDQYRAIKAQEQQQASQTQTDQTQVVDKVEDKTPVTPPVEEPKLEKPKTTDPTPPVLPDKVVIDGIGEVPFEELKKGYLRQADYTQKTQEVARQRKETEEAVKLYEQLKANPQLTTQLPEGIQVPLTLDPTIAKVMELENKLYDMMLEREIETLQKKYPDFEVREVFEIAKEKQMTNLEDAYLLSKSRKTPPATPTFDVDKIKSELRAELLKELEVENATKTLITPNGGNIVIQDDSPRISEAEKKVARMMKMTDADYVKWRDAN